MSNTQLNALRSILTIFREATFVGVDEAMMDTFLIIAHHNDKPMGEIVKLSGRPQSSTSRYLAKLSDMHRLGDNRSGPGLIVTYPDPLDPTGKRKRVRLTPKGEKLAADLVGVVRGAGLEPAQA